MNNKELEATLEQIAAEETAMTAEAEYLEKKEAFKARLPMLYTTRGKLIPNKNKVRISGKNAAELLTKVNDIANAGDAIVLVTSDYVVTFTPDVSMLIRAFGMVAEIMLAGYDLR